MLPEISRRCLACGASVRTGARFCHQCGALFDAGGAKGEQVEGAGEEGRPASRGAEGATTPAVDEEFALRETWREWESSVGGGEAAAPRKDERRDVVATANDGGEPEAPPPFLRRQAAPAPAAGKEKESDAGMADARETGGAGARDGVGLVGEREARGKGAPEVSPPSPPVGAASAGASETVGEAQKTFGESVNAHDSGAPSVAGAAGEAAAVKGRRAAAIRENLRPRVERVRDASRGVLEEASEDTGLRFVLISVGFFALFLFLLFLSYVVK